MSARLHAIATVTHVAPATAVVAALVDEQPGAISGSTFANSSQEIAGEKLGCAGEGGKKNPLYSIGYTRPFRLDPVSSLSDAQQPRHVHEG